MKEAKDVKEAVAIMAEELLLLAVEFKDTYITEENLNEKIKNIEDYAEEYDIPFSFDLNRQMIMSLNDFYPYWNKSGENKHWNSFGC